MLGAASPLSCALAAQSRCTCCTEALRDLRLVGDRALWLAVWLLQLLYATTLKLLYQLLHLQLRLIPCIFLDLFGSIMSHVLSSARPPFPFTTFHAPSPAPLISAPPWYHVTCTCPQAEAAQQAMLARMRDEVQARGAELEAKQRTKMREWEAEEEGRRLKMQVCVLVYFIHSRVGPAIVHLVLPFSAPSSCGLSSQRFILHVLRHGQHSLLLWVCYLPFHCCINIL